VTSEARKPMECRSKNITMPAPKLTHISHFCGCRTNNEKATSTNAATQFLWSPETMLEDEETHVYVGTTKEKCTKTTTLFRALKGNLKGNRDGQTGPET